MTLRQPLQVLDGYTVGVGVACLIALLHDLPLPSGWMRQGTIHVAPDGFDAFPGHSRRFALRTIQAALDRVEPGETILIWPGVYRESIHLRRGGLPGRPIVLRSAVPGRALITAAADPGAERAWRWTALGSHLHATAIRWRVQALRVDGVAAYRAGSLDLLRDVCRRPGAWPAFHSSPDRLSLCLPDGRSPEAVRFTLNRPMPQRTNAGGHQVASLWLEAPYVEVRDLTFDFPVTAAIQLWNTHHVRIVGNVFNGADVAINQSVGQHELGSGPA